MPRSQKPCYPKDGAIAVLSETQPVPSQGLREPGERENVKMNALTLIWLTVVKEKTVSPPLCVKG